MPGSSAFRSAFWVPGTVTLGKERQHRQRRRTVGAKPRFAFFREWIAQLVAPPTAVRLLLIGQPREPLVDRLIQGRVRSSRFRGGSAFDDEATYREMQNKI